MKDRYKFNMSVYSIDMPSMVQTEMLNLFEMAAVEVDTITELVEQLAI